MSEEQYAQMARDLAERVHFKLGDSAATMHLACGFPIKDACWTQNPHEFDCPACRIALANSHP